MKRQEKHEFVQDMNKRLQDVRALFLADFRGMSVAQDNDLRAALTEAGVEMRVVKNRLFKLALKDSPFEGMVEEMLTGPNAILFVDDVVGAAKALKESTDDEDVSLTVKGGAYPDGTLTSEEIAKLATLPSREELIGKFVGQLQSPLRKFAMMLNAPLRDFATVLKALEQKKKESE